MCPKSPTKDEALQKAIHYCDYQDRSEYEVRQKLKSWKVNESHYPDIIDKLKSLNLLDEKRFAINYATSKFRLKKWGKYKIRKSLEQKRVNEALIEKALQQIDSKQYKDTLLQLIQKKGGRLNEESLYKKRGKIARYVIQKGYEPALAWEMIKEEFPST